MLDVTIERVRSADKVIYDRQEQKAKYRSFQDYLYDACKRHNVDFNKIKKKGFGNG